MEKKEKGYRWEKIVLEYYLSNWWSLVDQNYTIPGGEIDLILEKDQIIIFCEVKVVDNTEDLAGYVSQKKLQTLKKTVESYCQKNNVEKDIRLDLIFVKHWKILESYENIYF